MTTWAKIIAGLVSLFTSLVAWLKTEAIKKAERDAAELEARREIDRVNADADAARDGVSDELAAIKADPRNRRRQ